MAGIQIGSSIGEVMLDDPLSSRSGPRARTSIAPSSCTRWGTRFPGENSAAEQVLGKLAGGHAVRDRALSMHALTSSGVLIRHPRLRFCFAHGGGAVPRPCLAESSTASTAGRTWWPRTPRASRRRSIWARCARSGSTACSTIPIFSNMSCEKWEAATGSSWEATIRSLLAKVPVAGKLLLDESVGEFLTWGERAGVLSNNAIRFLGFRKAIPTQV